MSMGFTPIVSSLDIIKCGWIVLKAELKSRKRIMYDFGFSKCLYISCRMVLMASSVLRFAIYAN